MLNANKKRCAPANQQSPVTINQNVDARQPTPSTATWIRSSCKMDGEELRGNNNHDCI